MKVWCCPKCGWATSPVKFCSRCNNVRFTVTTGAAPQHTEATQQEPAP